MSTATDTAALLASLQEQIAALTAAQTPASAPTQKSAPKKPAGAAPTPFAGVGLADLQAQVDANPALLPAVQAELQARIDRGGKSAKNAQKALERMAEGGSIAPPKSEKANPFTKTPEEILAERTEKLESHRSKLVGEQAAVVALRNTIATNPGVVAESLAQALESAERTVSRRLEWIAQQEDGIKALGFPVPGAPAPRKARARKTAAA